jgi:predicted regulator of Ras-like GTPase activity (Roadblock/LC7/MglB family)
LDRALEDAVKSVPGCLAASYVDIRTGIVVSAKSATSHPQEMFDLVSAATAGLFHESNLAAIERWFWDGHNAEDEPGACREIVVISDNLLYLFERCQANQDHVAVFVTKKSDNVGLVMAKARLAVSALDCAA